MSTVEKIKEILEKANVSKVDFAKYLGVSRQMVYNYLDGDNLDKLPKEKRNKLFKLLDVRTMEEIIDIKIDRAYLDKIDARLSNKKNNKTKDELLTGIEGFKKEEQEILSDIVFLLKEMLNEDKTKQTYITLTYVYHFLQSMSNTKELRYMLAYVAKASGFVKPNIYDFEEERQFIFESIMYSAMTLYNNGGASRSKLMESHKRWEAEIEQKNVEKLSRTQELNTAKVQALKELGYDEITEHNAGEVFDKIAEIQARNVW